MRILTRHELESIVSTVHIEWNILLVNLVADSFAVAAGHVLFEVRMRNPSVG